MWCIDMSVMEQKKSPLNWLFNSVVQPHDADFWLQKVNPLWSVDQSLGKIVDKKNAAQDMVSLKILTNRHFQAAKAGQHHPIYVVVGGIRYERTYSLTQLDTQHVLLTVKKVPTGKVSTWLTEKAKVGDIIEFGQPYGEMQLTTERPLVLLAAGSGITPMYSLLREAIEQKALQQVPVHLMYWVKQHADAAFKTELETWVTRYSNFSFQIFYTQAETPDERLNATHLADLDIKNSTVYACGPSGFVHQVETLCQGGHVVTEAFSLAPISSADIGFVQITLNKSNQTISIPRGQSILVGLEQQNIKPNHGCRMGICNKCACNKVEGSTQNLLNGSQNTEPGNLLKLCVNSAQSDLIIDL